MRVLQMLEVGESEFGTVSDTVRQSIMHGITPWLLSGLLALASARTRATTYYVATTGSDGNAGTEAAPWATVSKAATNAVAGDLVLVQPGIYDEYAKLVGSGASNNPITFRANGAVTNLGTWVLSGSHLVIDGFEFTGQGTNLDTKPACVLFYSGWEFQAKSVSTNVWLINNAFHDTRQNPTKSGGVRFNSSGDRECGSDTRACVISNNFFYNIPATTLWLYGRGHLFVNNVVSNTYGGDAIRLFGADHVIRGNRFVELGHGIAGVWGCGNNDFNGHYYNNKYLTTNWARGYVWTNTAGYTFIVAPVDAGTPWKNWWDVGWSNQFNLASADGSVVYASATNMWSAWTMWNEGIGSPPVRSAAYEDHPDFVQAYGPYAGGTNKWYAENTSTNQLIEGNFVMGNNWDNMDTDLICALAQLVAQSGPHDQLVHSWTFRNNVFVNLRRGSLAIQRMRWHNNTFYRCGRGINAVLGFAWLDPYTWGDAYHAEVYNNAFIACGDGWLSQGWYAAAGDPGIYGCPPVDLWTNCNYNYVCHDTTTWAAKQATTNWYKTGGAVHYFYEPNGINGGDPGLVSVWTANFHLKPSSALRGKGKVIPGLVTDFDGRVRPSPPAIGAFDYRDDNPMRPVGGMAATDPESLPHR